MQVNNNVRSEPSVRLPEYTNNDAVESAFSGFPQCIRFIRAILDEHIPQYDHAFFEGEKAVDLKILKSLLSPDLTGSPLPILLGCDNCVFLLIGVNITGKNMKDYAPVYKNQMERSLVLLEKVQPSINVCGTSVVLLGNERFEQNKNVLLRCLQNNVHSLVPMKLDEFCKRVFLSDYKQVED